METYILKQNVLTDNLLIIPEYGKIFNGNYIAIIKEYTFLNSWNDQETVKKFRKEKTLNNYLQKNYPKFYY